MESDGSMPSLQSVSDSSDGEVFSDADDAVLSEDGHYPATPSPHILSSRQFAQSVLVPITEDLDIIKTIITARKCWKTIKGKGEVVWPPHLEAALVEGLKRYRPAESGPTRTLGRFPMRNKFISEYIFSATGMRRTPKQVGSRIQLLRDTREGKRILELLSSGITDLSHTTDYALFCNFDSPEDQRIQALLRLALISDVPQDILLGLVNDDAQHVLDAMLGIVDGSSFENFQDTDHIDVQTIPHRLRRLLLKLALRCDMLPRSLFVYGVQSLGDSCGRFGGFADIFLGLYGEQRVAIKRLRAFEGVVESKRPATKQAFYHEAITWRTLSHRHILPFLGIDNQLYSPALCMVSPWMERGAIQNAIDRMKSSPEYSVVVLFDYVQKWTSEISIGLTYLHGENVVHGDLRGANILIDDNLEVKLADFGLSVFADGIAYNYASTRAGATKWLAPELIDPEEFGGTSSRPTFASDIYSFACILIELYTGNAAFTGLRDTTVIRRVMSGKRPERPRFHDGDLMSDTLWSLTNECWSHISSDRPIAEVVTQRLSAI